MSKGTLIRGADGRFRCLRRFYSGVLMGDSGV